MVKCLFKSFCADKPARCLRREGDTPARQAAAFAVGTLIGCSPLFGLHLLQDFAGPILRQIGEQVRGVRHDAQIAAAAHDDADEGGGGHFEFEEMMTMNCDRSTRYD